MNAHICLIICFCESERKTHFKRMPNYFEFKEYVVGYNITLY